MAIEFSCRCGRTLRVKDEHAGRRVKCPGCGSVAQVPAAAKKDDRSSLQPLAQSGRAASQTVLPHRSKNPHPSVAGISSEKTGNPGVAVQNNLEDWFSEELSRPTPTPATPSTADRSTAARSPSRPKSDESYDRPRLRPRTKRRKPWTDWLWSIGRLILIVLAIVSLRPSLLGFALARSNQDQEEPKDSPAASFALLFLKVLLIVVLIILMLPFVVLAIVWIVF